MSHLHVDDFAFGDWDGQEDLAVAQFCRIVAAILEHHDEQDPASDNRMMVAIKRAGDEWGTNEGLLHITDAQIAQFVAHFFSTPH